MSGLRLAGIWILCIIAGAALGFGAGWVLWKLGFEIIGSSIALIGAGVGGILIFVWLMNRRNVF
ncbi:MAG TPA: hypothetical protein VD767_03515 [Thermomicrobiales bacterium]|nr:hypothetical protein [Thermomicrobiales bacterium]